MQVVLATERLYLRQLTLNDVDGLLHIFADPEAMRYYPATKNRAETEGWIRWNLNSYEQYGLGLWAVIHKASNQFLGDCGVVRQPIAGQIELEIGYHIRRDQWGHGYATEAARACREYAFEILNAPRVISIVHPRNHASRRVAEKVHANMRELVWEKTNNLVCLYSTDRAALARP